MSKRMTKIYVDMDGVLADFKKKWKELYGDNEKNNNKLDKKNFDEFVRNHEFSALNPMRDMNTLVSFLDTKLKDIPKEILSSTANEKYFDTASRQKKVWLNKQKIDWTPNFVPGKRHKKDYAKVGFVLIDDDPKNIEDWNKAGGIGILHKDALTTIALLKLHL